MEFLLLKYGYLLLFVGVFLEGEAFLIAGAFLANQGYFNFEAVVLVALAANTLGAQFYYLAARMRGRPWFENRFSASDKYRRILNWMGNYGNWVLLLSRFAFGFRIIIPAACGALGMSQVRFFTLNLAAGVLWVIPTAYLGYYFGTGFAAVLSKAHRVVMLAGVSAFLILAVYLAFRHWRRVIATFQHLELSDLHGLLPFAMGFMGVLNLLTAMLPRPDAAIYTIQSWLPLEVTQESRTLMLFAGVALLQVTRSLARRKQTAWYVAVIVLSISLLLHLTGGFDLQHSLVAGLLLGYLFYFRRRFYARSDIASMKRALIAAPVLMSLVFLYGAIGFYAEPHQFRWFEHVRPFSEAFRAGILIVDPRIVPLTRHAGRFLTSIQVAGWVSRVYILVLLLRPVVLSDRQEAPARDVARIFTSYGVHSAAAFAVQSDKHHLLLAHGRALAAFATKGAVAIACGDPMASDEDFPSVVTEFTEHCVRHGWTPSFYLASEERLPFYHSLGFASQRTAEEAIIDIRLWNAQAFRQYITTDIDVLRYNRRAGTNLFLDEQLEEVSEDWLETRRIGEMGFTIGRFSLENVTSGAIFVLGKQHRVEAFSVWVPYKSGAGMVLDLMRQRHSAPPNSAEMLISESLRLLAESGVKEASLSAIPLRQTDEQFMNPVDRDFMSIFQPKWENRYIVYPRGASLARIRYALAAVQFGRSRTRQSDLVS